MTACCHVEIAEKLIHIERSYRSSEPADSLETLEKSLVCCDLILVIISAPVSLPVQTNVPVTEILSHKILNCTSGTGEIIIFIALSYFLDKRVKQGDDPAIYFRPH